MTSIASVRAVAALLPHPSLLASGIRAHRDIIYHSPNRGNPLRLDVYLHSRAQSARTAEQKQSSANKQQPALMPVFLYIHGGGWMSGDKGMHSLPLLYQVCCNHRLTLRLC